MRFKAQAQRFVCQHAVAHGDQRVNNGVAGDEDPRVRDVLAQQILARPLGRGEVIHRQMAGERAVSLFRPRRVEIAGAQPRFDMADGNTLIKRGQAGRDGGCRIAMHQNDIRAEFGQNRFQPFQNATGDLGQPLSGLHDVQVVVRHNGKKIQHLVQHLPMLGGDANPGIERGILCQRMNQRRHFDSFWSRAKNG